MLIKKCKITKKLFYPSDHVEKPSLYLSRTEIIYLIIMWIFSDEVTEELKKPIKLLPLQQNGCFFETLFG